MEIFHVHQVAAIERELRVGGGGGGGGVHIGRRG